MSKSKENTFTSGLISIANTIDYSKTVLEERKVSSVIENKTIIGNISATSSTKLMQSARSMTAILFGL